MSAFLNFSAFGICVLVKPLTEDSLSFRQSRSLRDPVPFPVTATQYSDRHKSREKDFFGFTVQGTVLRSWGSRRQEVEAAKRDCAVYTVNPIRE